MLRSKTQTALITLHAAQQNWPSLAPITLPCMLHSESQTALTQCICSTVRDPNGTIIVYFVLHGKIDLGSYHTEYSYRYGPNDYY